MKTAHPHSSPAGMASRPSAGVLARSNGPVHEARLRNSPFWPAEQGRGRARPHFARRIGTISLLVPRLLTVLVALSGCSGHHSSTSADWSESPRIWPDPPDPPRIAYQRSLSTPAEFGLKVSALSRFGQWITGSGKREDRLRKPFGLALDENENVCLTDTGANTVCFFDRAAHKWRAWNKVGSVRFLSPFSVAKRFGTFFVADSTLGRIIVFREDGKLTLQITNRLQRPCAVTILNDKLFVADSQRHAVVKFDLAGNFLKEFGTRGSGNGQFNFPTHLTGDNLGLLYVTDSMNSRVQKFTADGEYKGEVGRLGDAPGHFGRPKGIALDSAGRLYALDAMFDNFQVFDQQGRLLLAIGETGSQPGQFWLANGIAITHDGQIYIADSYNRRLQVFKYVGLD
jgi:DNA-binding beta-propeller fold protein YncE